MYRVLLVDDEVLIREAIQENIKWGQLGFELAGACKDGREAMEEIRKNPPDLLLTDIYMPYIDGMELTKFVYENYPDTKVVIISGYDEFEYAKQAVKYQVVEYVLKPVTAFELTETLMKIKESLDEENLQSQNIKKIRGAYMSNLPVLKGRFLNSLLLGKRLKEEIRDKMEEFGISLEGRAFTTVMIEGDDLSAFTDNYPEEKNDLALFAIFNVTDELVNSFGNGVAFQNVEDKTIIILAGASESDLEERTAKICKTVKETIYRLLKLEVTLGVGNTVGTISRLSEAFSGTKMALEYRFLAGGGQVLYAKELRNLSKPGNVNINEWADRIVLAVKSNHEPELRGEVLDFVKALKAVYVPKNRSMIYVQNIIMSVMNVLDDSELADSPIYTTENELMSRIYGEEHLDDIGNHLLEFCQEAARALSDERDSYSKRQALRALDYIDKNYKDPKVSLNSVCTYLAMSTSYFSSVFKNFTGETFIEALTRKRMEKAKTLIENTSMKAYEIAEEVGYSDPHYFSSIFKKTTGKTPTEYAREKRSYVG